MKKIIGIVVGATALTVIGVSLFNADQKISEQHAGVPIDSSEQSQPASRTQIENQVPRKEAGEALEQEVKLTANQVAELQKRSLKVVSELDALTNKLAEQLEDTEKRKEIEAQYKILAEEHNQLAIQLVRASKQSLVVQE